MKDKVEQTIEKYHMFEGVKEIVVGLSGGADSVSLAFLLLQLSEKYGYALSALHFNHRLRGQESHRDEEFVRQFCLDLGIPLTVESAYVGEEAKKRKQSVEECGRDLRYEALYRLAESEHSRIATAHTLSDNAETVLFHLARGTALKGLCGIPPARDRIIRPLIDCTRPEIEDYCKENRLEYVRDSSNNDLSYTRNRIRHHVIPQLAEINSAFLEQIRRTVDSLTEDEQYLSAVSRKMEKQAQGRVDFLSELPASIRRRILQNMLLEKGGSAEYNTILRLEQIVLQKKGKFSVSGDTFAVVEKNILMIQISTEPFPYFEVPLREGEQKIHEYATVTVQLLDTQNYKKNENIHKKLAFCIADYDKIIDKPFFRQRMMGDRLRDNSRGVSKTLKKWFNEKKYPVSYRDKALILADGAGVVAAEGMGTDERCQITEQTKRVLLVTKKQL